MRDETLNLNELVHDIRNSLNLLSSALRIIERDRTALGEKGVYVDTALESADEINSLVNKWYSSCQRSEDSVSESG